MSQTNMWPFGRQTRWIFDWYWWPLAALHVWPLQSGEFVLENVSARQRSPLETVRSLHSGAIGDRDPCTRNMTRQRIQYQRIQYQTRNNISLAKRQSFNARRLSMLLYETYFCTYLTCTLPATTIIIYYQYHHLQWELLSPIPAGILQCHDWFWGPCLLVGRCHTQQGSCCQSGRHAQCRWTVC